jgi:hypothetical protein
MKTMFLRLFKTVFFLIFISIISILYLGQGQEKSSAVAKEVESFILHDIKISQLSVVHEKFVTPDKAPLSYKQEFQYLAKRLLILTGISIERESYTIEFNLQSLQTGKHIYCFVRVHGDQVLGIIIRASSKKDSLAILLQELIKSRFPNYDVPIFINS